MSACVRAGCAGTYGPHGYCQVCGRRAPAGEVATAKLGRAAQLAAESSRQDTFQVLARVVDVIDAPNATVRLRPEMEQVDAEMAAVRSRVTVRWRTEK